MMQDEEGQSVSICFASSIKVFFFLEAVKESAVEP